MSAGFTHPPGELPEAWKQPGGGYRTTAAQFKAWCEGTGQSGKTSQTGSCASAGGKHGNNGIRPDLGHNARSNMEANFARYLLFNGYHRWHDLLGDPPPDGTKWYRYEGRRFEFPGVKGRNYAYTTDFELWPGLKWAPDREPNGYECVEIKGFEDKNDGVRKRRMAKHYPEVPVVLVLPDLFRQMTTGYESVVPNWE